MVCGETNRRRLTIVEVEEVVVFLLQRPLVDAAGVLVVIQLCQRDCHVEVAVREVRLLVDCHAEVMKGACVLARVQMHESEVVSDDPLEWSKIEGLFKAGNGSHKLLRMQDSQLPDRYVAATRLQPRTCDPLLRLMCGAGTRDHEKAITIDSSQSFELVELESKH